MYLSITTSGMCSQDSLGCRASFPQPLGSTAVLLRVTAHSSFHMPLPSPTPWQSAGPLLRGPSPGFQAPWTPSRMLSF